METPKTNLVGQPGQRHIKLCPKSYGMTNHSVSNKATAFGATDAPPSQAAARNMRRPDYVRVRTGSLNVGTMSGKASEVVEMMRRRQLLALGVQETKWKGDRARKLESGFKMIHAGGDGKTNGVGVILSEELSESVVRVERWAGRIIFVWIIIQKQMFCIGSVYAPQTGRTAMEKKEFRERIESMVGMVDMETMVCITGDWNAHIGCARPDEGECVGKFGWGVRNKEGQDLIEMLKRNGLAVAGSFFQKREEHQVTYISGQHKSQVDLIVVRRQQLWKVKDCKAIAGEHITTQHKPVICTVRVQKRTRKKMKYRRSIRWWKCKDDVREEYERKVKVEYEKLDEKELDLECEWTKFKEAFVGKAVELCGRSNGKGRRKNQEWWTAKVSEAIEAKREAWKKIERTKKEGSQPNAQDLKQYRILKNIAKKAVAEARMNAQKELYEKVEEDAGRKLIYRLAKDRDLDSNDMKGGTVVKDSNGKVVTERKEVLKAWKCYFSNLFNQGRLSDRCLELPTTVRKRTEVKEIDENEVRSAMRKMKAGKAPGKDEVRVEMILAAGDAGISWTTRLLNKCMKDGRIPRDWQVGLVVPVWKGKGDAQDPGKYRGITLLSHVLKTLERILDQRIRKILEPRFGEEQHGFRPGRSTTDAMFTLRQIIEKKVERKQKMAVGFVDLEKAYDLVPRELVYATLRWMEVGEAEVRMIEGMYEATKARVLLGADLSNEFDVKVGLRQGSVLSPVLFNVVMELISGKIGGDALGKLMYADDLAVMASDGKELEEVLRRWQAEFRRHGLKVNVEKTEVMWIGEEKRLEVRMDGQLLKQVEHFVYLGGAIQRNGDAETEVRRRIQAGANAWRRVEGVMADRRISKKLKGKVLSVCVTPACTYGLETLALKEEQLKRLEVCENNWIRRIAGVKLVDKRRVCDLRKELDLKSSVRQRVKRSRLKWAGHVARMEEKRLPKRAMDSTSEGKRQRGRPKLRWADCVAREVRQAGVEEEWQTEAKDRKAWRAMVHKITQAPTF